jgi:hypothetical protein
MFQIPDVDTLGVSPIASTSTKNNRHSLWVYTIAGAFVGLLVITAITLWLSFQTQPVKVRDTSTTYSLGAKTSALLTGGVDTPATKSKVNSESTVSKMWLKENFGIRPGVLDDQNICLKVTICSDTADPDQDGLINIYEYNYSTDPNDPDTDKDGLTDTIELFVYFSNPKQKDSDQDLVSDFDELKQCGDPILSGQSLTLEKRAQIASDLAIFPARQPTLSSWRAASATDDDIKNGYLSSGCQSAEEAKPN